MHTSAATKLQPWRLPLDADRGQSVLASIHEIEGALVSHLRGGELSSVNKPDLAEGTAGIALFFAYLQAAHLATTGKLAADWLAPAVDALADQPMTASLYSGFTGIAWATQRVTTLLGDSSTVLAGDIDIALETYLSHSPWNHDYDLIKGLVGIGVYCLERVNTPIAMRCLELIVERLSELAEPSG